MALPSNKNISIKEYEKITKYKYLGTLKKMWPLKTTVKSIIIGCLDIIYEATNKKPKKYWTEIREQSKIDIKTLAR